MNRLNRAPPFVAKERICPWPSSSLVQSTIYRVLTRFGDAFPYGAWGEGIETNEAQIVELFHLHSFTCLCAYLNGIV